MFVLSARSNKALKDLAKSYLKYLQSCSLPSLQDICFTTNIGRSHFNHRLATVVTSVDDLQTKLTQYLAGETAAQLWQGKANSNRQPKLALIIEPEHKELKELIESVVDSSDLADIYWKVGDRQINNNEPNVIYSQIEPEANNWQSLIFGVAQLYILGVNIDWNSLWLNRDARKAILPTYSFQRSIYWID